MAGTSVNDYPVDDNYLVIDITMQNEGRRLSLFSDSRDYIEEQYIGIYRAKHWFDYMYSLYSAHLNNIMPNAIAEDATLPVVTLYGFDHSKDNGDSDQVKKHFTGRLQREPDTNLIILTDMIFIDVRIPEGSVYMQTYYAESSDGVAYRMSDNKWSPPHQYSSEELFHPSGNTFSARDINPDGFTGSIWAVTTDADGVEHISDDIPVIWVKSLAEPVKSFIQPTEAKWSKDQIIGADMVELDFANEYYIIFTAIFGLFSCDFQAGITRALDLTAIGCNYTQGDNYCEVSVSADGSRVYLHPMSSDTIYVYYFTVESSKSLYQTAYDWPAPNERFKTVSTEVAIPEMKGNYSHSAAEFVSDEGKYYGYLYTSDWTLGTLSYIVDDEVYTLFE